MSFHKLVHCRIYLFSFTFFVLTLISCHKNKISTEITETGIVSDVQGNVYKTVKIGDQWWMSENLKATVYRDGSPIALSIGIFDTSNWNRTGSYCVYDNHKDAPGLLYNWYAVQNPAGISPQGWHVPTDSDWKTLEMTIGMDYLATDSLNWRGTTEGEKLKLIGTKYWAMYSTVWNTNETGFSAMAGGCRVFTNQWSSPYGLKYMGFWWTSTPALDSMAWFRNLDYKSSGIFRYYGPKTNGFSIRCVKD